MRVFVLSDLHANLSATEAVLADAAHQDWDIALVLGDLVGYGADPGPVIDLVRGLSNATVIRGNHDKVASGIEDAADFNAVARQAVEWTMDHLSDERAEYLRGLPQGPIDIPGLGTDVAICHGAPFDEDYYLFDGDDAAAALGATSAALLFCGHTHVQMAFQQTGSGRGRVLARLDDQRIALAGGLRTLVNPGSVGQPRDGDPRAAYAMFDTGAAVVTLHRVEYDIEAAERRILEAGLHPSLAERLSVGR
ncbi:MAG: metallophosphoesterase family protein [Vicinamibacterales bacterium]